jgi:probable DNA metabolism protein
MTDRFAWRHDGSLMGFLCAIGRAMRDAPDGAPMTEVVGPCDPPELGRHEAMALRDGALARDVWRLLRARLGMDASERLVDAFRSDRPNAAAACAAIIPRALREGPQCLDDLADADAREVEKAQARTRAIAHRFMGIVRFSELEDGSLFSTISPECDVMSSLARHFHARMGACHWLLADVLRNKAAMHDPSLGLLLGEMDAAHTRLVEDAPLAAREAELRAEWKRYFEAVSILERENPSCQAGHLPLKYRESLPEFARG